MRTEANFGIILALGFAAMPNIASATTQEQIGSWTIDCPGSKPHAEACLMRFSKRFLDKAGITGDLEIQAQGSTLVPVIALRGMPSEFLAAASLAGKTEASIQFAGSAKEDLNCAAGPSGFFCSPSEATGRKLSAQLAVAQAVTVRVSVSVAGMNPLPAQEKSLDLSGTKEALARLRAVGPSQAPSPATGVASQSPEGVMAMADKMLKAAGFPGGTAGLQTLLAKYMKK
jgi:hypothetical protein